MKNGSLKAYSLAEICITMMLIAFLFLATFFNIPKLLPDANKAGFKKGYASLESAIASLLANEEIYALDRGFKDTGKITFEGTGIVLAKSSGNTKFRDAIKYSMAVVKDNISCESESGKLTTCFKTQDGVVYGIPDTDFSNNSIDIAFYPTWEDGYTLKDNGFNITVSNFGEISLSNNIGKNETIKEYMTSTTIRTKTKE